VDRADALILPSGGGEALSELARAFFYAGARALMVSHWPVNSDAAVSLAMGAIAAAASDPAIDRAGALQQAMLSEIGKGGRHAERSNWHPSFWSVRRAERPRPYSAGTSVGCTRTVVCRTGNSLLSVT
jgi:CHAT domain-containing protein